MTIFVTIAIFLCISRIVYCELRTIERTIYWGVLIAALWVLLRFQIPLHWCVIGGFSISFWDLSIGLLVLTSVFCLVQYVWEGMTKIRKRLWTFIELLDVYIKEVWQDKLFAFTLIAIIILYVVSIIYSTKK